MTSILVLILALLTSPGAADSPAPQRLVLAAESVGLPEGTLCELEFGASYVVRRVDVRKLPRGKWVAARHTDVVSSVPAVERPTWTFSVDANGYSSRELIFTLPPSIPKTTKATITTLQIPVRFAFHIPGKSTPATGTFNFGLRLDGGEQDIRRCFRVEKMATEDAVRMGLLPDCGFDFDQLTLHKKP